MRKHIPCLLLIAWLLGLSLIACEADDAPQSQAVPAASGVPIEIAYTYLDGTVVRYVLANAPQPTPPAPTLTPTAPATNTPHPTTTRTPVAPRTPTQTPIPASPAPRATATPPASETPVPTPTPEGTPILDSCTGIPATGWYIRSAPGGATLGYFSDLDRPDPALPGIAVQTFRLLAAREYNGAMWYAFWFDTGVIGWTHEGAWTLAGACDTLPAEPPVQEVRIGPHMLFNARADQLGELLAVSGVVKEVSGNGSLLAFARLLNPDVITVYRYVDSSLGNCAPAWMSGAQWFDALYAHWPRGATFYELTNECADFDRSYSNPFMIEAMQRANEVGVCLLLYSFGVGNPEIAFMAQITPALDYALANECQPGRYHAIAMHAYAWDQPRENIWYFSRWRQLCGAIPGYCERLGIYFTEWEHYDNESDPVNCARVIDNVEWAQNEYPGTPIRGIMLWSFGALQPWRDVTGCADAIARAMG